MKHDPEFVEPGSPDPEQIAEQQFLHALLGAVHESDAARDARLQGLRNALSGTGSPAPPRALPGPSWRLLSSAAAILLAVLAVFFVTSPGESASALVLRSIQASQKAGTRRYRIELGVPETYSHPLMTGTLDVQDREHALMQMDAHGYPMTVGVGAGGAFLVHPDGSLESLADEGGWPRWIDFDQSSILIEPIDQVLYRLHHEAEMELVGDEPLPGQEGPPLRRVVATTQDEAGELPGRVEMWIDPETREVRRLEYYWSLTVATHEQVRHRIRWPRELHLPEAEGSDAHAASIRSVPRHRMVYELEGHPELAPDWFTPGLHRH